MPAAVNPITHPAAISVDPNLEPERRVQALFHVWLRFYFSGVPFNTRAAGGGVEQRTFDDCRIQWQQAGVPDPEQDEGGEVVRTPQARPIIHGLLVDTRSRRSDDRAGMEGEDLDWQAQLMVKVPHNLTATEGAAELNPDFVARRVGDQLAWLLRSSERAALAEQGIQNLTLRSGPTMLTSGVWVMRMLGVTFRTRRETAHL